ncbi:MAG: hypothetical protein ACI9N0_003512, partial [Ilumatobacter sp.]
PGNWATAATADFGRRVTSLKVVPNAASVTEG